MRTKKSTLSQQVTKMLHDTGQGQTQNVEDHFDLKPQCQLNIFEFLQQTILRRRFGTSTPVD